MTATNTNETPIDEMFTGLLCDALVGKRAHVAAERAFEGLTWRQAGMLVPNSPHTIWQLLKHLNYWQDRFISISQTTYTNLRVIMKMVLR
jgi:hypothetical protein